MELLCGAPEMGPCRCPSGPIFDKIRVVSRAPPYEDRVGDDDVDGKDMAYRVVAVWHSHPFSGIVVPYAHCPT